MHTILVLALLVGIPISAGHLSVDGPSDLKNFRPPLHESLPPQRKHNTNLKHSQSHSHPKGLKDKYDGGNRKNYESHRDKHHTVDSTRQNNAKCNDSMGSNDAACMRGNEGSLHPQDPQIWSKLESSAPDGRPEVIIIEGGSNPGAVFVRTTLGRDSTTTITVKGPDTTTTITSGTISSRSTSIAKALTSSSEVARASTSTMVAANLVNPSDVKSSSSTFLSSTSTEAAAVTPPAAVNTPPAAVGSATSGPLVVSGKGSILSDGACNCSCECPAEMFSLAGIGSMPASPASMSQNAVTAGLSSATAASGPGAFGGFGGTLTAAGSPGSTLVTVASVPPASDSSSPTSSIQSQISTTPNVALGLSSIAVVPPSAESSTSTTPATALTSPAAPPPAVTPSSDISLGLGSIAVSGSPSTTTDTAAPTNPPIFSLGGSNAVATPSATAIAQVSGSLTDSGGSGAGVTSDVNVHISLRDVAPMPTGGL